jgi:hypothetical protein
MQMRRGVAVHPVINLDSLSFVIECLSCSLHVAYIVGSFRFRYVIWSLRLLPEAIRHASSFDADLMSITPFPPVPIVSLNP